MKSSSATLRAFLLAIMVGSASCVAFIYFWYEVKEPYLRTEEFFLSTVAASIALLTVLVFQSFRVSIAASNIAEGMAKSMFMYSQELFTELYRGSPVPYLVISHNRHVDSANFAAARLFGVEANWFDGKNIFEYLVSEEEHKLALIEGYFQEHVFVNDQELEIIRPDGSRRWVMLSLFSFKDANRDHKGLLTLVDITKQKQIDKAKTEFVSLASHQLRTPITAMKWNIELLGGSGKGQFTDTQWEYVHKIENGIGRMDALITDFLSVSKLELGTFEPHPEAIELTAFINTILDSHEKQATSRHITIERDWDPADILESDPKLLEMAVNNLISNAIKYTREGGVVKITSNVASGHRMIVVSDTGMGIPADEQEHIFTKIYRASNAKAEVTEGTGLGLYIAREAIRVMGGDLTFVSEEGKGTTFTILLPV